MDKELKFSIVVDSSEAADNLRKVADDVDKLSGEIGKAGKKMASADKDVNRASDSIENLGREAKEAAYSLEEAEKAMGSTGNQAAKAVASTETFGNSWAVMAQGINSSLDLLKKAAGYASSAFNTLKDGAGLKDLESSFKRYANSVGIDSDRLVASLKKASRGTISNRDLMLTANKALALGVSTNADELTNLLEVAKNKARLFGLSATQAFEDIVTGIGRNSPLILDNLGIRIPDGFAKMSEGMGDAQKRATLLQAVLKEGNKQLADMGGTVDTSADKVARLESSFANLTGSLKVTVAEGMEPFIGPAQNAADTLNEIVAGLKKVDEETGLVTAAVVTAGGAISGLALSKVVTLIADIIAKIKAAATAQLAFNSAALANPYVIAGTTAAGVGYLGHLAYGTYSANDNARENANELMSQNSISGYKARISRYNTKLNDIYSKYSDIERDAWISVEQVMTQNDRDSVSKLRAIIKEEEEGLRKLQTEWEKKLEIQKKATEEANKHLNAIKTETDKTAENLALEKERNKTAEAFFKSFGNLGNSFKPLIANEKEAYGLMMLATNAAAGFVGHVETAEKKVARLAREERNAAEWAEKIRSVFESDPRKAASNLTLYGLSKATGVDGGLFSMSGVLQPVSSYIRFNSLSEEELKKASINATAHGLSMAGVIGGNMLKLDTFTKILGNDIKENSKDISNPLADVIASAITNGFNNASFSNFLDSFGSGLQSIAGSVIGNTVSGALNVALKNAGIGNKGITSKNGSLNWGNIGSNLLTGTIIGAGANFLFGEGGIFGRTKTVGKENINKSAELNAQVDQAKSLALDLYNNYGISAATRRMLEEAKYVYTYTTSHKSKNLLRKKRAITIHNQGEAQASIANIERLQGMAAADIANTNYRIWDMGRGNPTAAALAEFEGYRQSYDTTVNTTKAMLESGKYIGAKDSLANVNSQISQVQGMLNEYQETIKRYPGNDPWSTKSRDIASYNWHYLNRQMDNLKAQQQHYEALVAEGGQSAYSDLEQTEAKRAMEEAKVSYINTRESARTAFTSNFLNNTALMGLAGQDYNGSRRDVTMLLLGDKGMETLADSESIRLVMPLMEQANELERTISKMLGDSNAENDIEAYRKQNSLLNSALTQYKDILKDAKKESLYSETVEEQKAAFGRWQEALNTITELETQIAENTETIESIQKSSVARNLANDLSDALTVVAETILQKGNKTEVYYQTMSSSQIMGKFKALLREKKGDNASELIDAINELEENEKWGDTI